MDIFQRNSMALGGPQVAPISLGQFGLPRPDLSQTSPMNTAGGLPLPGLGQGTTPTPPQNFLSPTELNALGGGRGRAPMFDDQPNPWQPKWTE